MSHLRAVLLGLPLLCPALAAADVPPPPGITRVVYTARFTGKAEGVVLVAFPADHGGKGNVAPVALDQDLRSVQGYVPGIYSVTPEVAAQLIGNEGREAVTALLAEKGHVCVKKLPRVFNTPTTNQIKTVADVFQVSATPAGCKATLVKTVYEGPKGERGEGTVDAAGARLPPAPFGKADLPPTVEAPEKPKAP